MNRIFRPFVALYLANRYAGILILVLVMTGYLFLEIKNNRFTAPDLQVYHTAAGNLLAGENLYRLPDAGHYVFKYAPVFAMYFIPLALLPFALAKIVYWLFLMAVICLGIIFSFRIINPNFGVSGEQLRYNNLILLTGLITGVHIARELELGQVNFLLMAGYIMMIRLYQKKQEIPLALLWAASVFIKPFGLIFLPWMLLRRRFKAVAFFFVFTAILAALPAIFMGPAQLLDQYVKWQHEISMELSAKQSLLADGNHTLFSLLARYTPVRFTPMAEAYSFIMQLVVALLLGVTILWLWQKGRKITRSEVLESAFLLCLIPLLAFTSYNAFGFSELAVCIVLYHWHGFGKSGKWLAVCGIILISGNIYEIWGRELWTLFNDLSLISIGTVLLLIKLIWIRKSGMA